MLEKCQFKQASDGTSAENIVGWAHVMLEGAVKKDVQR